MAITKMPLLSEKASGKLGKNLVFKEVQGRTIVSLRPSLNGRTPTERQSLVRSIFSELSSLQTTLTPTQVEDWKRMKTYKATKVFGDTVPKSVINSFLQVNFFRRDRGLVALMDAPSGAVKGNLSNLSVVNKTGDAGTITVSWTLPAGAVLQDALDLCVSSPFKTLTRQVQKSDFRHVSYAAGNTTSADIPGLVSGNYYYVRARFVMEDGRVQEFLRAEVIQVV